MEWTPEELAAQAKGTLVQGGAGKISGAFIDSRRPLAGGLFVPIVAARDGHDFIEGAVEGGAAAVLIGGARPIPILPGEVTVVRVNDTLEALTSLGAGARAAVRGPVVAIAGSNGKTTTRSFVEAALGASLRPVLCTQGNLNNHLGVPLTLLGGPHDPAAMVLELGMSAPGENDALARLVAPDVGVITSIGVEHFEFFSSVEEIAEAEFEIAAHIASAGALVVPSDEPLLEARAPGRACDQLLRVGPCEDADVRVESAWLELGADPRTHARIVVADEGTFTVRLRTFGLHNARNAAAALAVTKALGLPLDAAAAALEEVHPVGDRGRVRAVGRHALIADCYNANPASMEVALRSFAALKDLVAGPRVAVLGDMLELGPGSPGFHREVGAQVAATGVDLLVGVGPEAAHAVAAALDRGVAALAVGLDEVEAAVDAVVERLEGAAEAAPGAVLVKASRGVRLERVVEGLAARLGSGLGD